jgi:transposase
MLRGRSVQQIYLLAGQGMSVREIARTLQISRNSVRKYLRSPEVPTAKVRAPRPSLLDPYKDYVRVRLADGLENCEVLLRELRARGYGGGISILKDYVQPFRQRLAVVATERYETEPGEQAQVDFGVFRYERPDGTTQQVYGFVMLLSWSRALYVEFVRRADLPTFLGCHVRAFEALGGIPKRCLYDNTKLVVLSRDEVGEPVFTPGFLDFSLRVGFEPRLCQPYRPQTKGRVESGIKYVRGNFWPGARFVDEAGLNEQARAWVAGVANQRIHGTTYERPAERLVLEQPTLRPLPERSRLVPFLRETRTVGRDGYVQWERGWYGVSWKHAGQTVEVQADAETVQLWAGSARLAVHPRATRPGQRLTAPGQWEGLPTADGRPRREALASQVPTVEVQQRSLAIYEALIDSAMSGFEVLR